MSTLPTPRLLFVSFDALVNWSVRYLRENQSRYKQAFSLARIGDFLTRNRQTIEVQNDVLYTRVTVKLYNKGVLERDKAYGRDIGTKRQFVVQPGQFILSKIDARNGAFGVVPPELDGAITTADFLSYRVETNRINPAFLTLVTSTQEFLRLCQSSSSGTTGRQRVNEAQLLNFRIPLPTLAEQDRIVEAFNARLENARRLENEAESLEQETEEFLFSTLGVSAPQENAKNKVMSFINFNVIQEWSYSRLINVSNFMSNKFSTVNLEETPNLYCKVLRGKSPVYDYESEKLILNQKCIRWFEIKLEYAKKVSQKWYDSINADFRTVEGDVLINSTGEGTIGRAAIVNKDFSDNLFDSHILCLRLNFEKINPHYFVYLFNSQYGQKQIDIFKSAQSTNQTELGISNLLKIVFPLPEINLQTEFVEQANLNRNRINNARQQAQSERVLAIQEFEAELFAS